MRQSRGTATASWTQNFQNRGRLETNPPDRKAAILPLLFRDRTAGFSGWTITPPKVVTVISFSGAIPTDFAIANRQSDVSFRVRWRNPCHHEVLSSFEKRNPLWSITSHSRVAFMARAKDGASIMGAQRRTDANSGRHTACCRISTTFAGLASPDNDRRNRSSHARSACALRSSMSLCT